MERPQPPRVDPSDVPGLVAGDAVVLIGSDGAPANAAWEHADGTAPRWPTVEGALEIAPGSGSIYSTHEFGDVQLHLEWLPADEPSRRGQGRSNSGVGLMGGRYQIQILDSWENETYADGRAASIYGQFPPLADVTRPLGEWQSFDLFFRRPRVDDKGTVMEPARLTLLHNGILVQNNETLVGETIWLQSLPYDGPHPVAGPIELEDHGSPVRFRNVWVRPIPERSQPPAGYAPLASVSLTRAQLDRLVGTYRRPNDAYTIARRGDGIELSMPWRPEVVLPLVPESATSFHLAHTAGTVKFETDASGEATGLVFTTGGVTYRAARERHEP